MLGGKYIYVYYYVTTTTTFGKTPANTRTTIIGQLFVDTLLLLVLLMLDAHDTHVIVLNLYKAKRGSTKPRISPYLIVYCTLLFNSYVLIRFLDTYVPK